MVGRIQMWSGKCVSQLNGAQGVRVEDVVKSELIISLNYANYRH